MRQSHLLLPLSSLLIKKVFAGCCLPLLEVGPSRHYLCNPCAGDWIHTPPCSSGALTRFFPKDNGLTLRDTRLAHESTPAIATSAGSPFRGCSHSIIFNLPHSLGPPIAPTGTYLVRWAAGPFTPRIARAVTLLGMWHRYMTDTGNCHGWTFTSWIAALSAAPSRTGLSDHLHLKACGFVILPCRVFSIHFFLRVAPLPVRTRRQVKIESLLAG